MDTIGRPWLYKAGIGRLSPQRRVSKNGNIVDYCIMFPSFPAQHFFGFFVCACSSPTSTSFSK